MSTSVFLQETIRNTVSGSATPKHVKSVKASPSPSPTSGKKVLKLQTQLAKMYLRMSCFMYYEDIFLVLCNCPVLCNLTHGQHNAHGL